MISGEDVVTRRERQRLIGSTFANETLTLTPGNYVLPANHRLLWVISVRDSSNNGTMPVEFDYNGGATTNTTGSFDSNGVVCLIPVRISLTKEANKLSVSATGDTITYPLRYYNPSSVAVTNLNLYDPLPTGRSLRSSTGGGFK